MPRSSPSWPPSRKPEPTFELSLPANQRSDLAATGCHALLRRSCERVSEQSRNPVTIYHVAKAAGVAPSTVSRACGFGWSSNQHRTHPAGRLPRTIERVPR